MVSDGPLRARTKQLFQFLEALNATRHPVTRRLADHGMWRFALRDLPEHESIQLERPNDAGSDGEALDTFRLTVRRAPTTHAPDPPAPLDGWLKPGWQEPGLDKPSVRPTLTRRVPASEAPGSESGRDATSGSDGDASTAADADGQEADGLVTVTRRFADDPRRPQALAEWSERRRAWLRTERPARAARALFEDLYDLRGRLGREAERVELVLGDGLLNWRVPGGGVHHTLLHRRLRLDFDPETPAFTLEETGDATQFYDALLRELPDVDAPSLATLRQDLSEADHHPLGGADTNGFLKALTHVLSSQGTFVGEADLRYEEDEPRLARAPAVFLRRRVLGYATALRGILRRIDDGADAIAPALRSLVMSEGSSGMADAPGGDGALLGEDDVLLTKPANDEQLRIAQCLASRGAVVVQGPPGTGKTHTIANLLGHLLAEGKSVLVSSHTSKALQRVREQVVGPLRPLCVSVLSADEQSRDELEKAIRTMAERLSTENAPELEARAERLGARRREVQGQLRAVRAELRDARRSEYEEIVVGGRSWSPSEAARLVDGEREAHGWMPEPVTPGASLPVAPSEALRLYATNAEVTQEAEAELAAGLPSPQDFPDPEVVRDRLARLDALSRELTSADRKRAAIPWTDAPKAPSPDESLSSDAVARLAEDVEAALREVDEAPAWARPVLWAGWHGAGYREAWDGLLAALDETRRLAAKAAPLLVEHDPELAEGVDLAEQRETLVAIAKHLRGGGSLSWWTRLTKSAWHDLAERVRVNGHEPTTAEAFEALRMKAVLDTQRQRLRRLWSRLLPGPDAPAVPADVATPERAFSQHRPTLDGQLAWFSERWAPLRERLVAAGFKWDAFLDGEPPVEGEHGDLERVLSAIRQAKDLVRLRARVLRLEALECWQRETRAHLRTLRSATGGTLAAQASRAFEGGGAEAYSVAYERVRSVHAAQPVLAERQVLLRSLGEVAPAWAEAIRARRAPHDRPEPPGDVTRAWRWAQLRSELERRAALSEPALQRRIDKLERTLHKVTQDLAATSAWAAQVRRVEARPAEHKALLGWVETMKKVGKGYGKRVPMLLRKARELLKICQGAVPVWIMPASIAVEQLDAESARFDVLIVDEASQMDVMGLALFYMAKQVVVVGDDEQVSPSAVGVEVEVENRLMELHLKGIPNAHLFDGKTSVYDIATRSFSGVTSGGRIRLREHFRCVPEIIQFSNALAYDFEIRPLRDASGVALRPHVVEHRVTGASYDKGRKTNEKEARHVASLVVAAAEDPAYDGATFGIVSLVGEKQAALVEKLVRDHLSAVEVERCHLMAGNPAQFQGAERDVMFLSLVNAPREGPLPLRATDTRRWSQRFNVAASRARDQMWVVHSLDPAIDLKDGDVRRMLIEHARDPSALVAQAEDGAAQTDSVFEAKVLRRLVAEGYRVIPQWKVGAFRVDLVVEGSDGTRLAIECDGERYHQAEDLDADLKRQAILERLGWRFVRIRGSVFFRDPARAVQPVFERLDELGINRAARIETAPEGASDVSAEAEGEDVAARVRRRAEALRRDWGWENTGSAGDTADTTAHGDETKADDADGKARQVSPVGPSLPSSPPRQMPDGSDTPTLFD